MTKDECINVLQFIKINASCYFLTASVTAIQEAMDMAIESLTERKGHWIKDKYGNIVCSECNGCAPKIMVGCLADRHLDYVKSDYCWNCGARMKGEEE